ncbi:MAG: hypothetical protein M3442_04535 [Chloroflexota bacterium]|nr:hypothetical protein [Chloroflexota bacterium]
MIVVSRFWLVDETALIERLQSRRLRAGLDVFEEEPLAPGHPLRSLPNAILTPHRTGGTLEGYWRIGRHFVDDVEHFATGRPPSRMAIVDPRLAPQQEVHGV